MKPSRCVASEVREALRSRTSALAAAALFATSVALVIGSASPVVAENRVRHALDIPAQDLGSALTALGAAANEQVLFAHDVVSGLRSPQVKGEFTTDAAVALLLKGSGLHAERTASGVLLIRNAKAPEPPKPTAGIRRVSGAIAAILPAMIGVALAQAPSPSPSPAASVGASPKIDYGFPPRDYKRGEPPARAPATELALEAVQVAVTECGAKGFKVTAAVFDSAVQPVALLTANGALRIAPEAATRKAFVVLHTKEPSGAAAERVKSDLDFAHELAATGKALPVRGALPIRVGDEIIGAISVAGAPPPGEADEACARAGLDKISARLK